MRYRPLGRSGITVSEIGFGAWGIGGRTEARTSYGDTDDATSRRALMAAFDHGVTFFDTAPAYGDGRSESLIGEAFSRCRDRVVIATKGGQQRFADAPDYSEAGLRQSLDASLRRLRTDWIDVYQLHSPPPDIMARLPEIIGTLERLRAEGKIRHFGVSVKSPVEALAVLGDCQPAAIQVNLNMLDWRAIECGTLARALACGVGVVARTPLCFGFLSGAVTSETRFADGDHRAGWPRDRLARWTEATAAVMAAAASPPSQTWAQTALRFCLSFDAVATVIPGPLTATEAVENAMSSDLGVLEPEVVGRIGAVYRTLGL